MNDSKKPERPQTVLVTGGAGFIGSNYIKYLTRNHPDVNILILDKITYAGNLDNLCALQHHSRYHFMLGDICDRELVDSIFTNYDIQSIVNFAAESHVDRSIEDPEIFIRTNIIGTFNLLNIARKHWSNGGTFRPGKKFIQVSTDEVYGSLGNTGYFTESSQIDPHNPYSASKAGADLLVKSYFDTYRMPINITRCCNNYGPYQFPEKLIPLIISKALRKESLPIHGDGLNIRDWLYVEDHCSGIELVRSRGRDGEVYNIGGNNEMKIIEIVAMILEYLHHNCYEGINDGLIQFVQDRKGQDRRYAIDSTKIRKELGWSPQTTFIEGIHKTIEWYLRNREWMEKIKISPYLNNRMKVVG